MVALLRPRIREEQVHGVERAVAELLANDVRRVARDHADVRQTGFFEQKQQVPDTGLVDLDAEVVDLPIVRGAGDEGFAVAEADVEHARGAPAEQRVEIERRARVEGHAVARQQPVERAPLRGREPARAANEAPNLAKMNRGHVGGVPHDLRGHLPTRGTDGAPRRLSSTVLETAGVVQW